MGGEGDGGEMVEEREGGGWKRGFGDGVEEGGGREDEGKAVGKAV